MGPNISHKAIFTGYQRNKAVSNQYFVCLYITGKLCSHFQYGCKAKLLLFFLISCSLKDNSHKSSSDKAFSENLFNNKSCLYSREYTLMIVKYHNILVKTRSYSPLRGPSLSFFFQGSWLLGFKHSATPGEERWGGGFPEYS